MHRGVRLFLAAAVALAMSAQFAAAMSLESAMRSVVSVLPIMQPESYRSEEPEGSGVVVGEGRHIVTAMHVIEGAEAIRVRSRDGEVMEARLYASDPYTDLALLEIEGTMVPAVMGGDPALGDRVCAVGNAFGLDLSVSCGVVSGVHRAGVGFNRIEDFVQTDAAVNPGASGGALVDESGRVVGILSAIFTRESDANIGVNFAVAAPLAQRVTQALLNGGAYQPVETGLTVEGDPPAGESGRLAARVADIAAGSPAERAGLREGDRIIAADGRRVRKPSDLVSAVARFAAPASIELAVERSGRELVLRLDVEADMPEDASGEH